MNKDAILATIIGFGVGLVIAAVVFLGPSLIKGMPALGSLDLSFITKLFSQKKDPSSPSPTPVKKTGFSIQSPLAESIETEKETLVSGTAPKDSVVVLSGEVDEAVVIANNQGAYAGKLTLSEGKNEIIATSYQKDNVQSESVLVFYTPEDF